MASNDGTYGITGIPSEVEPRTKIIPFAPGMPVRCEISSLFPSNDALVQKQWTLMILALEKFKNLSVDKKLSYFQIAGIHGYPETAWDGADPPPPDPDQNNLKPGDNANGGYCSHNSITFPTWHRPYMLLYEQCIWSNMKGIIASWDLEVSLSQEWYNAADTWRLPYWDWARKQSYNNEFALPEVFTLLEVPIYPPSGQTIHPNPLWGFENPEKGSDGKSLPMGKMPKGKEQWSINDDGTLPWSQCSGISRYGILEVSDNKVSDKEYTGLEGVNNFAVANQFFADFSKHWYNPYNDKNKPDHPEWDQEVKPPGTLADAVNRMFSSEYNSTWGTFATTKWWAESEQSLSTGYMSLEYIHNNIHNMTGGTSLTDGLGHMSDVPVAAFDPIFWLHHCNVDRLVAIWQALNWSSWWDSPEPGENNVPDPTPKDPLMPFHTKDNGDPKKDFWTSEMARDWTKAYYQYDDLQPQASAVNPDNTLNEEKYIEDLRAYIHSTYPNTAEYARDIFDMQNVPNDKFFGGHNEARQTWDDYIINVVYDRYALNGRSYSILFYLRSSDDVGTLASGQEVIGQVYAFGGLVPASGTSTEGCANCGTQRAHKTLSKAQVPLTIQLMTKALDPSYEHIGNIEREDVERYLKTHLRWKFVQIGGVERQAEDFPDTKVSVWVGTGSHLRRRDSRSYLPPRYAAYTPMHDVTHGKVGGLGRDDAVLGTHRAAHWNFRTA
ncbi:common central domain of tyrosinase-domain-containing protein [Whalleya microplaca]|nr:common central domain of tyrosinase-domain-containing protein [Whalleya microplaca]